VTCQATGGSLLQVPTLPPPRTSSAVGDTCHVIYLQDQVLPCASNASRCFHVLPTLPQPPTSSEVLKKENILQTGILIIIQAGL